MGNPTFVTIWWEIFVYKILWPRKKPVFKDLPGRFFESHTFFTRVQGDKRSWIFRIYFILKK